MTSIAHSGTRLALPAAWGAWFLFFAAFGFAGLNLQEEGYLLTLAQRVSNGEVPYRDFEYLRPPFSILIQAALLYWVPGYGIAASRWYLAAEAAVVLGAVYALLGRVEPRRPVRAVYALLAVAFAFTGGVSPMPWHTVDSIFFSVLAAWALVAAAERHAPGLALAAGLAAALAVLGKQGFLVVALGGLALTVSLPGRAIGRRPWTAALAYVGGGVLLGATTLGYLVRHGALGAAIQSVLLDPQEIIREVSVLRFGVWELLVGMHLPSPGGVAVGLAVLLVVVLRMPAALRSGLLAAGVVWAGIAFWLWGTSRLLNRFFLGEVFLTTAWIGSLGLLVGYALGRLRFAPAGAWAIVLGLCTAYGSSWSYVPGFSAVQGLVLALPFVLLALSQGVLGRGDEPDSVEDTRARRVVAGSILLYAGVLSLVLQVLLPYREGNPGDPIVPFESARLRGIRSAALRVRGVDGVVDLVRRETVPADYVFSFMHFSALYFLAERRNPTRVDWFIPFELTRAEVMRAVTDLKARPPRLVILSGDSEAMLRSPRLRPIFAHIVTHYREAEAIGEFLVLRPRSWPIAAGRVE